jgi:hypothetical protein
MTAFPAPTRRDHEHSSGRRGAAATVEVESRRTVVNHGNRPCLVQGRRVAVGDERPCTDV